MPKPWVTVYAGSRESKGFLVVLMVPNGTAVGRPEKNAYVRGEEAAADKIREFQAEIDPWVAADNERQAALSRLKLLAEGKS